MKLTRLAASVAVLLGTAAPLLAIIATSRILIESDSLTTPIEITDRAITGQFMVWSGLGTYSRSPQTGTQAGADVFMIDWRSGPLIGRPAGLPRYKVSFYGLSHERGNATRPPASSFSRIPSSTNTIARRVTGSFICLAETIPSGRTTCSQSAVASRAAGYGRLPRGRGLSIR
jgi:hypothetical protein